MKEATRECWKKYLHYFLVERFFSTFWTVIGLVFLISALCILPKALRIAFRMRGETREILIVSRSALRETRKALHDSYRAAKILEKHLQQAHELNQYLQQPFQVNIQLQGRSDWIDMKTEGKALIAPQEKTPAVAPVPQK